MARLEGKTGVVLGCSASGGTGWAIARGLADAGVRLIVSSRSVAPLQELARLTGGRAVACDVGDPAQVAALGAAAREEFGTIDIAVNAAGLPAHGSIAEADPVALQATLDVNYLGNVHFIKHMAALMRAGGSIVLISSSSAHQPVLPYYAYACAKAAADCLVRYAAMEYGPKGIRVNSIVPGPIRSDMARELWDVPGVEEVYQQEIPLRRIGEPRDYADAVLWLAGDAFVTGLNLPLSGGNHLTRSPRLDELPLPQATE